MNDKLSIKVIQDSSNVNMNSIVSFQDGERNKGNLFVKKFREVKDVKKVDMKEGRKVNQIFSQKV